jgi:hypothetical protein
VQLADLITALTNNPATAGWDAVCALGVGDVNALLLRAYAWGGSVKVAQNITISATIGGQAVDLDLQIGPPLISFTDSGDAAISMWVTGGTITAPGSGAQVTLTLAANSVQISGTVPLAAMDGSVNNGGQVGLDLTAGTFSVNLTGLGAPAQEAVATAIAQYFAGNNIKYGLGTVFFSAAADYKCLAPTSFSFGVQSDPNGSQCLLIFITTNGTPGQAGPISLPGGALPIPDGYTAALLVANKALFTGVVGPELAYAMSTGLGGSVTETAPANNGGPWQLDIHASSAINAGGFGSNSGPVVWTTTAEVDLAVPDIPVQADQGLGGYWDSSLRQEISYEVRGEIETANQVVLDVSLSFPIGFTLSVEPGGQYGQVISIAMQADAFNPVIMLDPGTPNYDSVNQVLEQNGVLEQARDAFLGALTPALQQIFSLDFTPLSVFALASLLFASQAPILLQEAYAPADLLAVGAVQGCVAVTPPLSWVLPGQSVTLSAPAAAAQGQSVAWKIFPMTGCITESGVYTAPADIAANTVITVTATTSGGASGAAIIVAAAPLVVTPAVAQLPPGEQVQFFATRQADVQQELNWTIDPQIGQIGSDGTYTAPGTVTSPVTVTVTAQLPQPNSPSAQASVQLLASS